MSITRVCCLQYRVREDAPGIVKNCAAILLRDYCRLTTNVLSKLNAQRGYERRLHQLFSSDTNVKVSELEQFHGDLADFAVYQFQYNDNRYKTFAVSNIGPVDIEQFVQHSLDPKYIALREQISDVMRKYLAIFPDDSEPMEQLNDWHMKTFGKALSPSNIARFILSRPAPVYLTDADSLNQEDLDFIYRDLCAATKTYFCLVGYNVGKQYITNQYIPDIPDSKVKILHQNLIIHPTMNVVGMLFGTQMGENYYYGGHWTPVDLPGKESYEKVPPGLINHWMHERIDNYINYMKMEGMDNIHPVYIGK